MGTSQHFVIGWLESVLAAFVLLAATRLVLGRIRQPADRINLILAGITAATLAPLLIALAPLPKWHLGLVSVPPADNFLSAVDAMVPVVDMTTSRPNAESGSVLRSIALEQSAVRQLAALPPTTPQHSVPSTAAAPQGQESWQRVSI